jgi:hypothetical protein
MATRYVNITRLARLQPNPSDVGILKLELVVKIRYQLDVSRKVLFLFRDEEILSIDCLYKYAKPPCMSLFLDSLSIIGGRTITSARWSRELKKQ